MNRRNFLRSAGKAALLIPVAPAICRAEWLMPIEPERPSRTCLLGKTHLFSMPFVNCRCVCVTIDLGEDHIGKTVCFNGEEYTGFEYGKKFDVPLVSGQPKNPVHAIEEAKELMARLGL